MTKLKARGEIRGGRFVTGFVGEQFALPEAIEALRAERRSQHRQEPTTVSAADPLSGYRSQRSSFRGVATQAYWTEPGEYTLGASYATALSPAPPGSKDAGQGFGRVTLTAAPVKIKVEGK